MRIAYVVGSYPSQSETFVEREIGALAAHGITVEVFALWRSGHKPAPAGRNRRVHRVSRLRVLRHFLVGMARQCSWRLMKVMLKEGWAFSRALWQCLVPYELSERIEALGIDRVHAHFGNEPAFVGAGAASGAEPRRPFTFSVHARDVFVEGKWMDYAASCAERIIACNSAAARRAAELVKEADRSKIVLVPHGLPLDRYAFRAEMPKGEPLILGAGRFVEKKGFAHLVEAIVALRRRGRGVRCWLIGEGPGRQAIERQIARLAVGDAVELKGWLSQEDLMKAYGEAWALAAPCVVARDGDMDGLPNVVLEAAALGVPLVTTDVGGLPDLVRDGETGLVARPGDAADLAAKLEAILVDPATAVARARRAREAVEARHDEAKTITQLLAALGLTDAPQPRSGSPGPR